METKTIECVGLKPAGLVWLSDTAWAQLTALPSASLTVTVGGGPPNAGPRTHFAISSNGRQIGEGDGMSWWKPNPEMTISEPRAQEIAAELVQYVNKYIAQTVASLA
jgi:hypothetical protein